MARQLSLLEPRRGWQLSETTREVGRKGVASARASLEAAIAAARTASTTQGGAEHPRHGRTAA